MFRRFIVAIACLLCQHALAGTIYKCHEGGRVSYSDRPCTGAGAQLALRAAPVPDPDTQARMARAHELARAIDARHAGQTLREDLEAERARRAALALRKRCDKLRLQRQWLEEDLARTRGDAKEAARIKARRQVETMAVECPA
ncbi:DUF4124 domain-containing protein [Telluria beijingensis]|uniref:DUF4124 domain-containing protein n=1 Tax=Telluria beijingensis TaxID=3068633 RepID=UPI00279620F7|nr:DUF4124 domain-containing protein [Massilia sp. REN29]